MENLSGNDAQFIYGSGIKQPFSREEQGIYKKPIEHHGGVWMWGLVKMLRFIGLQRGEMRREKDNRKIFRVVKVLRTWILKR